MEYKFFDKRFLVMPNDKEIIGKKVFYNDNLTDLIDEVEQGNFSSTATLDNISDVDADDDGYREVCHFEIGTDVWMLAYHDPNYEYKVAYIQGKRIQFWYDLSGEWVDVENPIWGSSKYRIKPEQMFDVVEYEGKYQKVPYSEQTSYFHGIEEECDTWISEHTPKTRRMTNKELARWCANNKGQYKVKGGMCYAQHVYYECDEYTQVSKETLIRDWDSNEWHEPLVDVSE